MSKDEQPKICGYGPVAVEVEEGQTYSFCPCGLSATQPFCDGEHKKGGTTMRSLKFTPEKSGKVWLCLCKRSKTLPYCDGTHNALPRDA